MRHTDANIFLRYLARAVTPIDQKRAHDCRALFERVRDGIETITTCEAILAEVVFVLGSPGQYGLSSADISARLKPIIQLRGLILPRKRLYLRALDIFASTPGLDFEDAISVAYAERRQPPEIYSYDSDFDEVAAVTRVEP
jgi:predicted nucleic acid-binding protein